MKNDNNLSKLIFLLVFIFLGSISKASYSYIVCKCYWDNNYVGNSKEYLGEISLRNVPGLTNGDADRECRKGNPAAAASKIYADDKNCYGSNKYINTMN